MSKLMNNLLLLFSIILNHLVTSLEFFHRIRLVLSLIVLMWRCRINLDYFSIEDFDGFMFLHLNTWGKFFLWSLIVQKASLGNLIVVASAEDIMLLVSLFIFSIVLASDIL